MKKITLYLLLSWFSLAVFGQENFEGTIYYSYKDSISAKPEEYVTVSFKNNKAVFISFNSQINPQTMKGELVKTIYDFDLGLMYHFNDKDSIILSESIYNNIPIGFQHTSFIKLRDNEKIADLNATKYKVEFIKTSRLNFIDKIEIWFADEIVFKTSDSLEWITPPFFCFYKQKISLKTVLEIAEGKDKVFYSEIFATKIERKSIPDSIFSFDKSYRILSQKDFIKEMSEKSSLPYGALPIIISKKPIKKKSPIKKKN